jgi:hypothetical protein
MKDGLNTTRTTFRKVEALEQQADMHYRRYKDDQNFEELQKAIGELKSILELSNEELPARDDQRANAQKRCEEYERRYKEAVQSERARLLAEAEKELHQKRVSAIRNAMRGYQRVAELIGNSQDPDVETGFAETRKKLHDLRTQLATETETLLNANQMRGRLLGVHPDQVGELLHRVQEAQQATDIDPVPHRQLNEAEMKLQEAKRRCDTANEHIKAIHQRWVEARRKGEAQFGEIKRSLESTENLFDTSTYTHIDLYEGNPDRLRERITDEEKAHETIRQQIATIKQGLSDGDVQAIDEQVALVKTAEDTINRNTRFLHERGASGDVPDAFAARYPRQYEILSDIVEHIKQTNEQIRTITEHEPLDKLLQQVKKLQDLLKKLDGANESGLQDSVFVSVLDPAQFKGWQQAYNSGQEKFDEAEGLRTTASQKEQEGFLEDAARDLEQSRDRYKRAMEKLKPVLHLDATPYEVVKRLQYDAQHLHDIAETAYQQLENDQYWKVLQNRIANAAELLKQAREALREGDYVEALHLTDQAAEQNPALENDEDWRNIRGEARQYLQDSGGTNWIPVAGTIAVVLILVVVLGPIVWGWIYDFLFPAGIVLSR